MKGQSVVCNTNTSLGLQLPACYSTKMKHRLRLDLVSQILHITLIRLGMHEFLCSHFGYLGVFSLVIKKNPFVVKYMVRPEIVPPLGPLLTYSGECPQRTLCC